MRRLKEILVALDDSSAACHALQESMRLAKWAKGRVTAIAVAPSFEGDLSLVGVRNPKDAIEGPSAQILNAAFSKAADSGMQIDVICEEGDVCERIARRAREGGFDLVVLGREPHRPFRHLLFSTLPVQLASQSPGDILVLPESAGIRWERALYLDWQSDFDGGTFSRALDLCQAYGSLLLSVRIDFTKGRDAELVVCEPKPAKPGDVPVAKKRPSSPRTPPKDVSRRSPQSRDLAKAIGGLLVEERIGVLLLPYRPARGIGGWVTRRFLDRLILESPCPVMILKT